MKKNEPIFSRSLPVTNKKVAAILSAFNPWHGKILDLGAGNGYFSSLVIDQLAQRGLKEGSEKHLFACDMYPEAYMIKQVPCSRCDLNNEPLPYTDSLFDAVCSVEVIEHTENHFAFLREVYRVLKSGGVAVITTPNILNINSRLRSLCTGFPLLFDPLPVSYSEHVETGGHINPISYYHLLYAFHKTGFRNIKIHTDRLKPSGAVIASLLYPFIKSGEYFVRRGLRKREPLVYAENHALLRYMNSRDILLGRTLIIEAIKP